MAEASYGRMVVATARLHAAFTAVAEIPKPVVAAITGYALGGGLELALCADFRVAGESAQVGQPEILLGIIPGGGGTQRLPRLIGPARAKDLVFTGRVVGAGEALAVGLVHQVVPGGGGDWRGGGWQLLAKETNQLTAISNMRTVLAVRSGGGGVTAPDQWIEAARRVAPGPVQRAGRDGRPGP